MDQQTFTDEQVTEVCKLYLDNLRELITWKAVLPVQRGGGRGRVRLWSLEHVQRIAAIAAIFNSGFSLRIAHTIGTLVMTSFDEMFQGQCEVGDWLNPDQYATIVHRGDFFINIIDDQVIALTFGNRTYGAAFIGLFDRQTPKITGVINLELDFPGKVAERGEAPGFDTVNLKTLAYVHDPDADTRLLPLDDYLKCPVSLISINVSLAARIACRKALGLPVSYP